MYQCSGSVCFLTSRTASGFISQMYGSEDPDPQSHPLQSHVSATLVSSFSRLIDRYIKKKCECLWNYQCCGSGSGAFLTHGSRIRIRIRYTNPSFLKTLPLFAGCTSVTSASPSSWQRLHLHSTGWTALPRPTLVYVWLACRPTLFVLLFRKFVLVLLFW